MKLLIGNTGVIGTTLKQGIKFDYEFNSSNLKDLLNLEIDSTQAELYLSCLPATKWLINQDPQSDLENIYSILEIISKKSYKKIILYSTIDVYENSPLESDESYNPNVSSLNYGSNRLLFEKLVTHTLTYTNLLILRLPAIFGDNIKKNILFDLLNNNEIHKIKLNSQYQWYNLNDLVMDTEHCLVTYQAKSITINLFPEPIATSELLSLCGVDLSQVDSVSEGAKYNFKTNSNPTLYVRKKKRILSEIEEFITNYKFSRIKVAVCLFGEPRDILNRIKDWERFSLNLGGNIDFYLAFYSTPNIHEIIQTFRDSLSVKSFFITENDLSYFDSKKYKLDHPVYIYGTDYKATFARISSQAFIRQKAISSAPLENYDAVILCRSDLSNFNLSKNDIIRVISDPNLLIVNSETHIHPGGGSGCVGCNINQKCDLDYHANDICDLWCVGSPQVMNKWNKFYDDLLPNYQTIQKTTFPFNEVLTIKYKEYKENNEVVITPLKIDTIENDIHCFYPEKLMRVSFKDVKVVGASSGKKLWA
jgi:hypothetical protein